MQRYTWQRRDQFGYEVSSKGDSRFSALYARMPDGRTIEQHYQCDVKGYQPGGTDWHLGKGKPPLVGMSQGHQWEQYLSLWKIWAELHPEYMQHLYDLTCKYPVLTDRFATTSINQAHALATIINEAIDAYERQTEIRGHRPT